MINFGRIEENIFIGNAPQSIIDISRLKQMKMTAVVSLQSDQDLKSLNIDWKKMQDAYLHCNISVQRFPIVDFDKVDLGNKLLGPVQALDCLLQSDHQVYVHCNAGVCRAPATVLGYLCHYRSMPIDQGLAYIRRNRPQANPYISSIEYALAQLAES